MKVKVGAGWAYQRTFLLFLLSFCMTWAASPSTAEWPEADCQLNVTAAYIEDRHLRLAVGATTLNLTLVNVNFTLAGSAVVFDRPVAELHLAAFGCSCGGDAEDLFVCDLRYEFEALAGSLAGMDLQARVQQVEEDGSAVFVTNWTRVASIVDAPVIFPSLVNTIEQYSELITIRGEHLGLPGWNASWFSSSSSSSSSSSPSPGDALDPDAPSIDFLDARNESHVQGIPVSVSAPEADTLLVRFINSSLLYAIGPLQARLRLWGATTPWTAVASVIRIHPDETSLLHCQLTMIEGETKLCVVSFRGKGHYTESDSLAGFSVLLGDDSLGEVGEPCLSEGKGLMVFNLTAGSRPGKLEVFVRLNGSEVTNSPFSVRIDRHPSPAPIPSGTTKLGVPWEIVGPIAGCTVVAMIIVCSVATCIVLRRRRRRSSVRHYAINHL